MAVDDIIGDVGADNTALAFQPAAGVEIIITCMAFDPAVVAPQITDGTLTSVMQTQASRVFNDVGNMKIGIKNDHYISMIAGGAGKFNSYSGIQTK